MRHALTLVLSATVFFACPEDDKRPIGGTCGDDSQCASGLCSFGECLDPAGDEDGDGLINGREAALGSNPFNRDTDYDGVDDLAEVGAADPVDADGDSRYDVVESLTEDMDGDCIPDQLDANDTVIASEGDVQAQAQALCGTTGVCKDFPGGITVTCSAGVVQCDYSGIAQFQSEESNCDGLDNDCDGGADEGQPDADDNGVADCVDPDKDGDAVVNTQDNCADEANNDQADADEDALGDACDAPSPPELLGFEPEAPNNAASVMALGRGEPLSTVSVFADSKCTVARGQGGVDGSGAWELAVTLEPGANSFFLRATNRANLTSSCVASTLVFERDVTLPEAPWISGIEASSWGEGGAAFVVTGATEPGATIQLYSDITCATAVGEALAQDGFFRVQTATVATTTSALYVTVVDAAGNMGACSFAGNAFGPIEVIIVNEDDKPVSEVAVQFHYPDGSAAGPLLLSDLDGKVVVEGFGGFSLTANLTQSQFGFSWSSLMGLMPGQIVKLVRRADVFVEVMSYNLNLTFPPAPEGTSWIRVLAPCGYYYLQASGGAGRGNITVSSTCFSGPSFDLALVAYGLDGRPSHYLVKSAVARPTEEQATIAFAEAWRSSGWLESSFTFASTTPLPFEVGMEILARGDTLDSADYDYGGQSFATPGNPGEVTVLSPPIPSSLGRWWVEVPLLVLEGVSRVGVRVGGGEPLPLSVELDAQTDFMPRIFGVEAIYPPPSPEGAPSWVPREVRWSAEPGLARADAFRVGIYFAGPNTSVSWEIMGRPTSARSFMLPKLDADFPGAGSLDSLYYSDLQELYFIDSLEHDGFESLLDYCRPGADCSFDAVELQYTTCCDSNNED